MPSRIHSSKGVSVLTYDDVDQQLGKRDSRKLRNNTYLKRKANCIAIEYHGSAIVAWYPNGETNFSVWGFNTVTTRERINTYLPYGVSLSSYHDNVVLWEDGNCSWLPSSYQNILVYKGVVYTDRRPFELLYEHVKTERNERRRQLRLQRKEEQAWNDYHLFRSVFAFALSPGDSAWAKAITFTKDWLDYHHCASLKEVNVTHAIGSSRPMRQLWKWVRSAPAENDEVGYANWNSHTYYYGWNECPDWDASPTCGCGFHASPTPHAGLMYRHDGNVLLQVWAFEDEIVPINVASRNYEQVDKCKVPRFYVTGVYN